MTIHLTPASGVKPLSLTLPTVHLNGTSKQALLEGYIAAADAVRSAIKNLQASAPHGRDYYPQNTPGRPAINLAIEEHVSRLGRLESVLRELNALALHVSDGGGR